MQMMLGERNTKLDDLLSVGDSFYIYGEHCTAIIVRIVSISSNGWYKLEVVQGSKGHCGEGIVAEKGKVYNTRYSKKNAPNLTDRVPNLTDRV